MITFIISLIALVVGYIVYGRYVEKTFGPDNRPTPAVAKADGVDFIVLPGWKIFMIQFLNIAGTGPIFGAIMGIWYGPSAYLWIVFGCIFAGAMHDYMTGMLSTRHEGAGLPALTGKYLGGASKKAVLVLSVILLMMVGVVFVFSPAALLSVIFNGTSFSSTYLWIGLIFVYYIIATMLPVDKIIGRIYPLFAFALLFMAFGLMIALFVHFPALPELWDGLGNMGEERLGIKDPDPLFPALFVTIACGALSGFHATQSPLMARCMENEKQGRPIFYGSMITEGIVALVWATVSSYFFYNDGWREVLAAVDPEKLAACEQELAAGTGVTSIFGNAAEVVFYMCKGWLGIIGGVLAILGVVAAPITSGDTAFRSARLIIAESFNLDQKPILKRFYVCIPMFLVAIGLLMWQSENKDGFNVIWKYFGWANQTLAMVALWVISVFLYRKSKNYWISLIPAIFMTVISVSFFCVSKTSLHLDSEVGNVAGIVLAAMITAVFFVTNKKKQKS